VQEWYDIQDRTRLREVQKFGAKLTANLSRGWPPRFGVCRWALVVQSLDQGALAFLEATPIGAHSHLEDEIDTSGPALIDRRAECGWSSSIVQRRDEKDIILGRQSTALLSNVYIRTYAHMTLTYACIYLHIHANTVCVSICMYFYVFDNIFTY
jgi:hypothetical protein